MKKGILIGTIAAMLMAAPIASATVHTDKIDVDMEITSFHLNYVNETSDGYVRVIKLEHDVYIREAVNKNLIMQVDYCGAGSVVNGITVGEIFDCDKVENARLVASWEHDGMRYYTYVLPDNSMVRFNTKHGITKSITRLSKVLNDCAY